MFCLDDSIAQIKSEKSEEKKEKNFGKIVIAKELSIMSGFKVNEDSKAEEKIKQEEEIKNVTDNQNEQGQEVTQAKTNVTTEVIENSVKPRSTDEYKGVKINNSTSYTLTEEMLNPDGIDINMKKVGIYHTHTCESYTPTENYNYDATGNFRTTDLNFSVVRVGDELTKQLESYQISVVHDKTLHDYPAYNGSYSRSLLTAEGILRSNQDTDIMIDLHRDAIADSTYAPKVKIGEDYASQLMFVIGSDGSNKEHSNWTENLKFAIKVQQKANEMYPGLFKPIILRNSEYNQHISKAAGIIEVGATGNTLEESMNSMKYLAKIFSEL